MRKIVVGNGLLNEWTAEPPTLHAHGRVDGFSVHAFNQP